MEHVHNPEIITTRIFSFGPELVFKAFTDPNHLKNWWGPKGFTNTFHIFDLQPGGKWSFTMHGPDGGNYPNESEFITIEEPRLISWNHLSNPVFKIVTTFEALAGNQTRLVFTMIFPSDKDYEKLKNIIPEKNEENMDRLEEELKKMAT